MKLYISKIVFHCFFITIICVFGIQLHPQIVPSNWHLLDKELDNYMGISLEKAYALVKNKPSKTVIVAVIDGGVDTAHDDLKQHLWNNPREIKGNGIDDDHNGYIDDIYGWNFIGAKDGRNMQHGSLEMERIYVSLRKKYGSEGDSLKGGTSTERVLWEKIIESMKVQIRRSENYIGYIKSRIAQASKCDSLIKVELGTEIYTGNDLTKFQPSGDSQINAKDVLVSLFADENNFKISNNQLIKSVTDKFEQNKEVVDLFATGRIRDYRTEFVGDKESDIQDISYGNSDVMANTSLHGTHVSGILGAVRGNLIGMDGVADNVRIMTLRVVPDGGDEDDKDVALAIRYAVDNGAKIINMSFGKAISPHKEWVDAAVKYAESKDVLLVHAAGNEIANTDTIDKFPNPYFNNDKKNQAPNWITVGASGDPKLQGMTAFFSNYGKATVDLFAPGMRIYSTVPANGYANENGTSMAAPIVSGIAALILSYYPSLSAKQLKYIIEKSVTKIGEPVEKPESLIVRKENVLLSDLCKTGGIVNAFEAIRLAARVKGERKVEGK